MKIMNVLFQKTRTGNLLFPVCFFICKSQQFLFYPLSGSSFALAMDRSCAAQKIGVSHRLHPFPISLYKALYGVLTAKSSFFIPSAIGSNFTPFMARLTSFPCMSLSLIHFLLSHSHFELYNGQKIGVVSGLHLFLIAEINVILKCGC